MLLEKGKGSSRTEFDAKSKSHPKPLDCYHLSPERSITELPSPSPGEGHPLVPLAALPLIEGTNLSAPHLQKYTTTPGE